MEHSLYTFKFAGCVPAGMVLYSEGRLEQLLLSQLRVTSSFGIVVLFVMRSSLITTLCLRPSSNLLRVDLLPPLADHMALIFCNPATVLISSSDLPSTSVRPLRYRVPHEILHRR